MMPERIGIIGSTHGVNASRRPNPRKLASTSQKLPDSNNATMSKSLAELESRAAFVDEAGTESGPCVIEGTLDTAEPPAASLMEALVCIGT